MIYISSSGIKDNSLKNVIEFLIQHDIRNIELSGGTSFLNDSELKLLLKEYQNNEDCNFILHNYFPAPKEDFILNLASLDNKIVQQSLDHLERALDISAEVKAPVFAFHAGFFLDISLNEIGKPLNSIVYENYAEAYDLFCERYHCIEKLATQRSIKLFIENNVYSSSNYKKYGSECPLMFTQQSDYYDLMNKIEFNALIDLAHLYVSCNSFKSNFADQAINLINKTDYIHISDNNGLQDSNNPIGINSDIHKVLQNADLSGKIMTLEIYDSIENILHSQNELLNCI